MILPRISILLVLIAVTCSVDARPPKQQTVVYRSLPRERERRAIDLTLGADHEENVGTDVSVEALLNLWESPDRNTRIDAAATYNQRFGPETNGNARFGGKIVLHHDG